MSLFDGCDDLIDRHLNIPQEWIGRPPKYRSINSLNLVSDDNLPGGPGGPGGLGEPGGPDEPDGAALIADLYWRMMDNWRDGGCPANPSPENWRFTRHPDFQDAGDQLGPEVALERTIIQVVDHENWANQIPVDSGILGRASQTLDLAFRAGSAFELIELKAADGDTPLSAAFQILRYGLAYAFFRKNLEAVQHENGQPQSPLLDATEIRLRVLAPAANYERSNKSWLPWLRKLEARLDQGVKKFSRRCLSGVDMKLTGFQFDVFPEGFHWDQNKHDDEEHRREVLVAVHRRHPYFGQ